MQQKQFIDIINQPGRIDSSHLPELEILVKEYPFFESAHLLYTKGLLKLQPVNYSKQLRKTAIIANSRSVLYELLHRPEIVEVKSVEAAPEIPVAELKSEPKTELSPISVTNSDIKIIYVNTVPAISKHVEQEEPKVILPEKEEIDIVKAIENDTEVPVQEFNIDKLNKTIAQEINQGIIESYVQTDIIRTPALNKTEVVEPNTFTDWLKTIQKDAPTFQIEKKKEAEVVENVKNEVKSVENEKKSIVFEQKKQLIDKIIESDPGRIKLGTNKFFTPATDAKQSLLENEHLVTETLAKIYALQGNISKAIRAYEILSLKFPQKSVYFASLIEKLKTNK